MEKQSDEENSLKKRRELFWYDSLNVKKDSITVKIIRCQQVNKI